MSRSGYVDDADDNFALGRWRAAVQRSIEGGRGQKLLRELLEVLDSMEDKRLYSGSFATADGEFCTLGVLGERRGVCMDDLGDEDYCDAERVGSRFGIAKALAAEIMYLNDEYVVDERVWVDIEICGPVRPMYPDWGSRTRTVQVYNEKHPEQRWQKMREWVVANLKAQTRELAQPTAESV